MAVIKELLRTEADGRISFGNYDLAEKKKLSDYEFQGDIYKVKTYKEITRLERNDTVVYESVPGTAVSEFEETDHQVTFTVEGDQDVMITLGLEEDSEYCIYLDDVNVGCMKTNMGGKLSFSVELEKAEQVKVRVVRA